ncbi:sensor domain-containing diguanylate cyclase [Thalassotalea sp. G2M2-11]|uniref:sensor domain-containing diguanylate cyclase n=1 Tax=Thalassotalea sp. G2M2-11 TaxID=2787627 RepID=UPI0019D2BFCE|nr:sensor domain-containing diguanylate cyclase [Thalassotalea sp. G2M2-11]
MKDFSTDSQLLNALLQATPDPCFILDNNGKYIDVLGGHNREMYHDARHLIGKTLHQVLPQHIADDFIKQIYLAIRSAKLVTYRYSLSDDDVEGYKGTQGPVGKRYFEAHIFPFHSADDVIEQVVWMAFDITRLTNLINEKEQLVASLEQANRKLEQLSYSDGLTQVYNRRFFDLELERTWRIAMRKKKEIALIIFDIDYFKEYNDSFGHMAGDDCLKSIAKVATQVASRATDRVFRYGGDEFIILLESSQNTSISIAEKLISAVVKLDMQSHLSNEDKVTISVGVSSVLPSPSNQPYELLKSADLALYQSKEKGRNTITYNGVQLPK